MPRWLPRLSVSACLLTAAVAGCDGVADPTYQGESLATLRGRLQIEREVPPAQVVLAWANRAGNYWLREAADVTGSSLTEFKLELFEPPVEELLIDLSDGAADPNEAKVAFATIAIMRKDAPLGVSTFDDDLYDLPDDGPRPLLGGAQDVALVYVDRDVQPGTRAAALLGGTLPAGFHLMQYSWTPQSAWDAHQACLADLFKAWLGAHPDCDETFWCRPGNDACDSNPYACAPYFDPTFDTSSCVRPAPATMVEVPDGLETLIQARIPEEVCPRDEDCLALPYWPG